VRGEAPSWEWRLATRETTGVRHSVFGEWSTESTKAGRRTPSPGLCYLPYTDTLAIICQVTPAYSGTFSSNVPQRVPHSSKYLSPCWRKDLVTMVSSWWSMLAVALISYPPQPRASSTRRGRIGPRNFSLRIQRSEVGTGYEVF